MSANDVNGEPLARFTAAIADMDHVLMSARMTCNDFEMLLRVAVAQSKLGAFAERLQRSPEESFGQQRERMGQIFQSGPTDIQVFAEAVDVFVTRGFAVYSPRRGWRFLLLERRFKREVESENKRRGRVAEAE